MAIVREKWDDPLDLMFPAWAWGEGGDSRERVVYGRGNGADAEEDITTERDVIKRTETKPAGFPYWIVAAAAVAFVLLIRK